MEREEKRIEGNKIITKIFNDLIIVQRNFAMLPPIAGSSTVEILKVTSLLLLVSVSQRAPAYVTEVWQL